MIGPEDEPSREPRRGGLEPADAASVILETVPVVMRAIRARMRAAAVAGVSVPQFRVLLYVRRHPGTGLSEIAEHLGTTLPAASELVNRLVRQGLVTRATDERERRRICLGLTAAGVAGLEAAEASALAWLRGLVVDVPSDRLAALVEGLSDLGDLVANAPAIDRPRSTRSPSRRDEREDDART